MNAVTFVPFKPNATIPFFEDYNANKTLCKVYNDGNCYVAIPQGQKVKKKPRPEYIKGGMDFLFEELYLSGIKDNLSGDSLISYIKDGLSEAYPNNWSIDEFISKKLRKLQLNLFARKKRFRRKAYLNRWTHFVTFTYDDEKQTEESFKQGLRKCLSNFHSRRGWLYMGVWERAPETQRLHFHALLYVPEGQMPGQIYEKKDYSTKLRRYQITHSNTFFEERFGRCDFAPLSDAALRHGGTLKYILKYIEKTEERIVYSRGIPTDFMKVIEDDDVACEMLDYVLKFVLFNDVIDYEIDVLHKSYLEDEEFTVFFPFSDP